MKGASGLLISITGGRDLTLYEVDEAATRIREEVDQDANIIVGATFDEGLEGIIRVSVVATGIDQIAAARASAGAARRKHASPRSLSGCASTPSAWRIASSAPNVRSVSALTFRVRRRLRPRQERGDRIRRQGRRRRRGSGADRNRRRDDPSDPAQAVAVRRPGDSGPEHQEPKAFIPPQPERIPSRGPRMPRIDELPMPAQNEIRARRGEAGRGPPGKAAHDAVATDRLGRPWPPRTGGPADAEPANVPICPPSLRTAAGAADAACSRFAAGAGLRVRQAARAAGSRSPSAVRHLCITGVTKISSKSRPSCAARPIERPECDT